MGKAVAFWGGALALGLAVTAWAGPTAQGAAFNISSCTTCAEQFPVVAGTAAGTFMVVWKGGTTTDPNGVSGRFFSSTGTAAAPDFRVKDLTPDQYDPAVARNAQGSFLVVWSQVANSNSEIMARRYLATGAPVGPVFKVNQDAAGTPTIPADFNPAVAATNDGGYLVAWIDLLPSGNGFPGGTPQVFSRKISPAGVPVGAQVRISTGLVNGDRPDVCVDTSGRPVVVWTSADGFPLFEPNHKGVSLRQLTSAGAAMGAAELVVAPPLASSARPAVSCGSGSTFVVVWHSDQPPAAVRSDILGQRFSRLGRPVGPAFRINTTTSNEQRNPSIAHDPKGNFVVIWQSYLDGAKTGIHGRRFGAAANALSPEFEVSSTTTTILNYPDVAATGAAGNFVVVWQAGPQLLRGQRFTP
jgi:hypothetical protein